MVRQYRRTFSNVRNGKQHAAYRSYTEDNLNKAVRKVQSKTLTLRQAAKQYTVPLSTLSRRSNNKNMTQKKAGHPTLFTRDEEQAFIHHLNAVSEWGFPFDTLDLRLMAKGYLDRQGRNCPQLRGNLPDRDWAQNFLKRQKCNVTQRLSANISTK